MQVGCMRPRARAPPTYDLIAVLPHSASTMGVRTRELTQASLGSASEASALARKQNRSRSRDSEAMAKGWFLRQAPPVPTTGPLALRCLPAPQGWAQSPLALRTSTTAWLGWGATSLRWQTRTWTR